MNDGQSNYGFLWILNPEQKWRSVFAASSDYSDPAKRPKLVVTYAPMKKYFYLKDHLGNIRVTIDENGDVKGYNDYYPFGLRMPGRSMNTALNYALYKYSSKELDEENGINWYYFGARYYDPMIGRWWSVDPMWEKYPSLSPYVFAGNNPFLIIDPDGMKIVNVNDSLYQEMQSQMSEEEKKYYQSLEESEEEYEFTDVYNGYQILKRAREYIDKLRYRWGHEDLTNGVDCSGFVWAIMSELGYNVGPRFTTKTMLRNGVFRMVGNWIEGLGDTDKPIWGDIFLWEGKHTGFYDPVPISNMPGLNIKGVLLSARQKYGKVHYADPRWWTYSNGKMTKVPIILRGIK